VVIGTDYTGSCKSNYHTITTTTAPVCYYMQVSWFNIYNRALQQIKLTTTI